MLSEMTKHAPFGGKHEDEEVCSKFTINLLPNIEYINRILGAKYIPKGGWILKRSSYEHKPNLKRWEI